MKPIRIVSTQERDLLQIRFWPTDICNFNCSYCFPGSHDNKYRYPRNTDLTIENFRKLFDYYIKKLNKKKFHLTISGGGEPTLWPELERFSKEVRTSHDVYITLVSNGSRTLRWWSENSDHFDDVVLSYHHEFSDLEHHIAVADLLFERQKKITTLVLMDAENWDSCVSIINQMKSSKHPWYIQTKEIVDSPGKDINSYSRDQLDYVNDSIKRIPSSDWILKRIDQVKMHPSIVLFDDGSAECSKPHTLIINNWNKFKGWSCDLGRESLAISADGSVVGSCQTKVFGKDLNIFSPIFEPDNLNSSVICPMAACVCQPDTHVSKNSLT